MSNLSDPDSLDDPDHPNNWVPSEAFWAAIPRPYLTRRALDEVNRRNRLQDLQSQTGEETTTPQRQSARQRQIGLQKQFSLLLQTVKEPNSDLRHFARGGGPDLSSIREYPHPTMSNRLGQDSKSSATDPPTGTILLTPLTQPTPPTEPVKPIKQIKQTNRRVISTPYDANYELTLARAGIFLGRERDKNKRPVVPANHSEILARLRKRRRSLSPSRFTEQDYERFYDQAENGQLESQVMSKVMPIIEGSDRQIRSQMGGTFNNLEKFDHSLAAAVPDLYDGASPLEIDHRVLKDLDKHIVPSTNTSRPAAPNFFLECKSPEGNVAVARRQAAHNGAIGARGMISLQSYPGGILQYDSNAYTFTNTYHNGLLEMYITHAVAPRAPDKHPSYYMTSLRKLAMTNNSKTFRRGDAYYRNDRDLAKEQRDNLIQQANQAVRQKPPGKHGIHSRPAVNMTPSMRTDSQDGEHDDSSHLDTSTSSDEPASERSYKRARFDISSDDENTSLRPASGTS